MSFIQCLSGVRSGLSLAKSAVCQVESWQIALSKQDWIALSKQDWIALSEQDWIAFSKQDWFAF